MYSGDNKKNNFIEPPDAGSAIAELEENFWNSDEDIGASCSKIPADIDKGKSSKGSDKICDKNIGVMPSEADTKRTQSLTNLNDQDLLQNFDLDPAQEETIMHEEKIIDSSEIQNDDESSKEGGFLDYAMQRKTKQEEKFSNSVSSEELAGEESLPDEVSPIPPNNFVEEIDLGSQMSQIVNQNNSRSPHVEKKSTGVDLAKYSTPR